MTAASESRVGVPRWTACRARSACSCCSSAAPIAGRNACRIRVGLSCRLRRTSIRSVSGTSGRDATSRRRRCFAMRSCSSPRRRPRMRCGIEKSDREFTDKGNENLNVLPDLDGCAPGLLDEGREFGRCRLRYLEVCRAIQIEETFKRLLETVDLQRSACRRLAALQLQQESGSGSITIGESRRIHDHLSGRRILKRIHRVTPDRSGAGRV